MHVAEKHIHVHVPQIVKGITDEGENTTVKLNRVEFEHRFKLVQFGYKKEEKKVVCNSLRL